MMPKSTATMRAVAVDEQVALDACRHGRSRRAAHAAGTTGSPRAPSAGRSWPWRRSAARSESGVPSIHSSVSTSRAVRSQSIAGTRKSGSLLGVLGDTRTPPPPRAGSPSPCVTERASVSTTSTRRSRRASGRQSLGRAARRRTCRRDRAAKRRSMPGRSTLTATSRSPVGVAHARRCTCAIEAAATGSPKSTKNSRQRPPERRLDRAAGLGARERRACGPAAARARAPPRRRRCRAASRGTGRA